MIAYPVRLRADSQWVVEDANGEMVADCWGSSGLSAVDSARLVAATLNRCNGIPVESLEDEIDLEFGFRDASDRYWEMMEEKP